MPTIPPEKLYDRSKIEKEFDDMMSNRFIQQNPDGSIKEERQVMLYFLFSQLDIVAEEAYNRGKTDTGYCSDGNNLKTAFEAGKTAQAESDVKLIEQRLDILFNGGRATPNEIAGGIPNYELEKNLKIVRSTLISLADAIRKSIKK